MAKSLTPTLKIIASVFVALLFLLLSAFFYIESKRQPYEIPSTKGWQTGDVFFSVGNSWKSEFVRFAGGNSKDVSHCGIVLMAGSKAMLIHMSTEQGHIVCESPEDYGRINDASRIIIRRPRTIPDTSMLKIRLNSLLAERKPFDFKFDVQDDSKYYCSELIVKQVFQDSSREYKTLIRKEFVYPQDIYNILIHTSQRQD